MKQVQTSLNNSAFCSPFRQPHNTRITTRLIRLSIMVLSVLILGMTGCGLVQKRPSQPDVSSSEGQPENLSSARILSISYEYGSYFGGYWEFDLSLDDGQVLFYAQGSNGIDLEIDGRIVPDSVFDELQNIITDNDIILWNGFSKQDTDILDGYGFALNIDYENGTKLSASGYMMEPGNYEQGHAALSEYFLALAENYSKYSFLDYKRMAENKLDLPIGVEVSLNNTPNDGVFSVAFFTDADRVLVSKDEAMYIEINECDENGNSIYRTYMQRG